MQIQKQKISPEHFSKKSQKSYTPKSFINNYNSYKNEKAPYAEKDNSKGQGRRNFDQYNSHYIVNFHFIKPVIIAYQIL